MNKERSKYQKTIRNRLGAIGLALAIMFVIAGSIQIVAAGTYNRYAASSYAWTYALNPNPAYRTFNADCTNFVSQSLYAGGWPKVGGMDYSNPDAWYYYAGSIPYYSYSWTVANDLYIFLSRHYSMAYVVTLPRQKPYPSSMQVGDLIQFDWQKDGRIDHSMIVTGYGSGGDLLISGHTNNIRDKSLTVIMQENPNARIIGWHIRDSY